MTHTCENITLPKLRLQAVITKDINYGGIVGALEPGGVLYWPKKQFEITFNNVSLTEVTGKRATWE